MNIATTQCNAEKCLRASPSCSRLTVPNRRETGGKCARKHRCLRMITDSVVIRGHLSLSPNG